MRVNIDYSEGGGGGGGYMYQLVLQKYSRCRSEYFRSYSYRVGLQSVVDTRSDLMWVSHSGTANLKIQ